MCAQGQKFWRGGGLKSSPPPGSYRVKKFKDLIHILINIKLDNCDSDHIELLSLIYPSTTLSVDAQVFTPSRGTPHESTSTDCPHGTHTPTSPYHSASSEAQTPIASGLQTPVLSKEMLQSLGTDPSWVIKVSEKSI